MRILLLLFGLLLSFQFLFAPTQVSSSDEIIWLVGSTPGDVEIKSKLEIKPNVNVDFIKWDLKLEQSNIFVLKISYGENKPNTLGFMNGGQSRVIKGTYSIKKNGKNEIYHFNTGKMIISMLKLNESLFHLLNSKNELKVGNGGWSFTLNNKNALKSTRLPFTNLNKNQENRVLQEIYDGRTPCQELANEYNWKVSIDCFKLKWKLTLNRDSVSYKPTTFSIRKVIDNVPTDIAGFWTIKKGINDNPNVTSILLNFENPKQTISLLVGDNNILYFLHKDNSMLVGNENFSFTLNRRF